MSSVPLNWNVIIKGSWNRAIFTPDKVSQKLFGLTAGTALEVFVPLDGMSPSKMVYNNIFVSVNSGVLEIGTDWHDYDKIKECLEIACRSIDWLKETPVFAGGYNIRYNLTGQDAVKISDALKSELDNSLSDADFTIKERSNIRAVEEGKGEIFLITRIDQQSNVSIVLNFNKNTNSIDEIKEWFSVSADRIKMRTRELLERIYHIEEIEKHD